MLLAVANTLVPACTRIWLRVRLAVSAAKSASSNIAFAGGHVFQGDLEACRIGLQGVLLKGAEASLQLGDLLNGGLNDLAGLLSLAADDGCVSAGDNVVEESDGIVSQGTGGNGPDADADLLLAIDLAAKLEEGPPAGDGEAGLSDAERCRSGSYPNRGRRC